MASIPSPLQRRHKHRAFASAPKIIPLLSGALPKAPPSSARGPHPARAGAFPPSSTCPPSPPPPKAASLRYLWHVSRGPPPRGPFTAPSRPARKPAGGRGGCHPSGGLLLRLPHGPIGHLGTALLHWSHRTGFPCGPFVRVCASPIQDETEAFVKTGFNSFVHRWLRHTFF